MAAGGPLSQWKCYEMLSGTQTEETISCSRTQSINCSLYYCLWLVAGGYFLQIISIFCVDGRTGSVSKLFLSLSSKINACFRQDLYNCKQCHFCAHAALQSTQNESSSEGQRLGLTNKLNVSAKLSVTYLLSRYITKSYRK